MDKEYIQYSKRLCKWSLIGVFVLVIIAMALVVTVAKDTDAIVRLVQYFATIAGVIATGYFGRASVEDFTAKKFNEDEESEG